MNKKYVHLSEGPFFNFFLIKTLQSIGKCLPWNGLEIFCQSKTKTAWSITNFKCHRRLQPIQLTPYRKTFLKCTEFAKLFSVSLCWRHWWVKHNSVNGITERKRQERRTWENRLKAKDMYCMGKIRYTLICWKILFAITAEGGPWK